MTGIVNFKGESILRLVVGDHETQRVVVDSVVDTGYTGFLTLPPATIVTLDLKWRGIKDVVLGDGCTQRFDVYSARIIWNGKFRPINKVNEADTDSLVGLGLLYGYQMYIQIKDGGSVKIRSLQDETLHFHFSFQTFGCSLTFPITRRRQP